MSFKLGILGFSLLSIAHSVYALPSENLVRLIVKYKEQTRALSSLKSQIKQDTQLPVKELTPMANGAYVLTLDSSRLNLTKEKSQILVLDRLRTNPQILYAVVDRVSYFKPVPDPKINDTGELLAHDSQWDEFAAPAGVMLESKPGLNDGAWAYTKGLGKKPVIVAVLDTGVALNPSLIDNLVKDSNGLVWGWNFAGNNNNLTDETKSYHGTHVAGTIAGYGQVMLGMGEDLKILPLKIPAASGMFYESSVINAMYWAVGESVPGVPNNIHPARVLNMSFGVDKGPKEEIDYCDEALQEAVFYARHKGAVLVAAAGNDNVWEHYNAPGICNGTLKIASTGPEGLRSYFSNYGPTVTIAAPGGDKRYGLWGGILSTVHPSGGYNKSGFDFYQGTSMATPHVAGVAGLIIAANQNLTPEEIEQILYTTTHNFGKSKDEEKSCVGKKPCGHGILDAENAVKAAIAGYDVLFSAPKLENLVIKNCGKNALIATKPQIFAKEGVWVQHNSHCASALNYQHPFIKQLKSGEIVAHYGEVTYKLLQSQYKSCQVIGFDGVGCYL